MAFDPISKIIGKSIIKDRYGKNMHLTVDWQNKKEIRELNEEIQENYKVSPKKAQAVIYQLSVAPNMSKQKVIETAGQVLKKQR